MAGKGKELAKLQSDLEILRGAIKKYLTLNDNPRSVPLAEVATVCMMTTLLPPNVSQSDKIAIITDLMAYHGFYPGVNDRRSFVNRYEPKEKRR